MYGGSAKNRIRFPIELLEAMSDVAGADKIAVHISPVTGFNDMHDDNPVETYSTLLKALNSLHLAYVHVVRSEDPTIDTFKLVRDLYQGTSMVNGGFDFKTGSEVIESGLADLVSYGTHYIANPDLVYRFKHNLPLAKPDTSTFYTPGPKGYTDYPIAE